MMDHQPELYDDLQLGWNAWEELSLSRIWRHDGTPSGLLHSEIREWLDLNAVVDNESRVDLYRTIKTMDLVWLSLRGTKLKDKRGNASSSNRGKKRKRR
tara:strand:- start:40967 stop:41263 length:297 start_codon:yes stop_codon:yes gene_type:complete